MDAICESIKEKYEYSDQKYVLLIPNRIEDIIQEGRALRHCIRFSDDYYERIQRRESYIAFLRKADQPEKSFYTLEFEPDGTVRQKRTSGDRQNEDFNQAVSFIKMAEGNTATINRGGLPAGQSKRKSPCRRI